MKPTIIANGGQQSKSLYAHPIIYRNRDMCWEAERERQRDCLAVQNFFAPRKLQLSDQVCASCGMRAYAATVLVDIPNDAEEGPLRQLRNLIELANRYLARLFKVEHYYNRMRDMDVTIAQMHTLMQSMADRVILT